VLGHQGRCRWRASVFLVAAAAMLSATNWSPMCEYTGGIGPPCGNGVLGSAGRIGCSGTHIDSKPRAVGGAAKVGRVGGVFGKRHQQSDLHAVTSRIGQMRDAIERCAPGRFLSKTARECQPRNFFVPGTLSGICTAESNQASGQTDNSQSSEHLGSEIDCKHSCRCGHAHPRRIVLFRLRQEIGGSNVKKRPCKEGKYPRQKSLEIDELRGGGAEDGARSCPLRARTSRAGADCHGPGPRSPCFRPSLRSCTIIPRAMSKPILALV